MKRYKCLSISLTDRDAIFQILQFGLLTVLLKTHLSLCSFRVFTYQDINVYIFKKSGPQKLLKLGKYNLKMNNNT